MRFASQAQAAAVWSARVECGSYQPDPFGQRRHANSPGRRGCRAETSGSRAGTGGTRHRLTLRSSITTWSATSNCSANARFRSSSSIKQRPQRPAANATVNARQASVLAAQAQVQQAQSRITQANAETQECPGLRRNKLRQPKPKHCRRTPRCSATNRRSIRRN